MPLMMRSNDDLLAIEEQVGGVRPRKNNNQSNERQVRAGQLRGGGGTCAAVCPGQDERGQAEPPAAFNSPPPFLLAAYHSLTTRDSLALLLKVKIPLGAGPILRRTAPTSSSHLHFFPLSRFAPL